MAGVIGAFFAAGIVTGVFLVAVRPRWRRRRDDHRYPDDRDPPTLREDGRPPRWPDR
jgi:hypothetical protein